MASRIDSTRVLNQAVLQCKNPPQHFINSSTATIYRDAYDRQMDEITGEIGRDFSMGVAKRWEEAFFETETPRTRKTDYFGSIWATHFGRTWASEAWRQNPKLCDCALQYTINWVLML